MTRAAIVSIALLGGCNLVFGVDEPELAPGAGGASAVTSTSSKSASGQGGGDQGGAATAGNGGQGGSTPCAGNMSLSACYACCAQAPMTDEMAFRTAFYDCGCISMAGDDTCSLVCDISLCSPYTAARPPNDTCVGCVVDRVSVGGACEAYDSFHQDCPDASDCAAFKECLLGCAS